MQLLTSSLALLMLTTTGVVAHLAAFTDGMFCPESKYKGPFTNFTDGNRVVFDPLFNLPKDAWFLSKGRNCLLAEPTGVWNIAANSEISVPWANGQNSTGFYADGKSLTDRPVPYSVTNPQVAAAGLISESKGLSSPNLHAANKSTAAGTAIAISYVDSVYAVTMENLIVISTAPQTPFERLANYIIPDLAPCDSCICVTGWVPDGFGQQNMYMLPHKCRITNSGAGRKPSIPGKVPGPGVVGAKQMIAAFQADGNNVVVGTGESKKVPTYSSRMGYMDGAQTDIFDDNEGVASEAINSTSGQVASSTTGSTLASAPRTQTSATGKSIALVANSPYESTLPNAIKTQTSAATGKSIGSVASSPYGCIPPSAFLTQMTATGTSIALVASSAYGSTPPSVYSSLTESRGKSTASGANTKAWKSILTLSTASATPSSSIIEGERYFV